RTPTRSRRPAQSSSCGRSSRSGLTRGRAREPARPQTAPRRPAALRERPRRRPERRGAPAHPRGSPEGEAGVRVSAVQGERRGMNLELELYEGELRELREFRRRAGRLLEIFEITDALARRLMQPLPSLADLERGAEQSLLRQCD